MHNVEMMFSVRQTPWHGQGIVVADAPTSADAIRLAGLDWNVIQEPVFTDSGIEIPGYRANIRDTDKKVLGIVTNRYKVVQNQDAFNFTDDLLGEGVTYETAGSLATGKRIWLLAKLDTMNITGEEIEPYLVFTNTHDGSGAVRVAITPVRVVCQNTLNLALNTAKRSWSCAHKGDVAGKCEEAKEILFNTKVYMKELDREIGELKLKKMTNDNIKSFIDTLIPIDDNAPDRTVIRLKDARTEIMDRYLYAPDLKCMEKSAYRFVNAVSDFATHSEPARMTKSYRENLFMKTIDGNSLIDMAYKMVS